MLELVPHGLSERYTVRRDGAEVGDVALGWLREGGTLTIDGAAHELRRERRASGAFLLLREGAVVATAHKPSAFRDRFDVEHAGQQYELVKASLWSRRFELRAGGQAIGVIEPAGIFTRRCDVRMPGGIETPVQVFLAALALLMWRRNAAAA